MEKLKNIVRKIFGDKIYTFLINAKRIFLKKHYQLRENIRIFMKKVQALTNKKYRENLKTTYEILNKYKNSDYIIFHNPTFIGVTSATKELFDNLVPTYDIYFKINQRKIAKTILKNDINKVYFSSFCYGWKNIIKYLKRKNPNIIIKTFSHGSHSQVIDTFGWNRVEEIISLYKNNKIDEMATCKMSLTPFYNYQKYKNIFLNNTVHFDGNKYKSNKKHKNLKIGVYSANAEWRKNMMVQVGALKQFDNVSADMVPLNKQAKRFADSIGVNLDGPKKTIKREELLKRMSENDVNLYITFSECAPMVPLESLEVGVPCITGNNHHYFKNTKLEEYLVVNNETDIDEIVLKINKCLKDKDKILELYKTWKKENDLFTKQQVEKFIGGK